MTDPLSDLEAGYGSLTAADVARLDAAAAAAGVGTPLLMEAAGFQVARCADAVRRERGLDRVVVLCGSGNNGGDGLVAARLLASWGAAVSVAVIASEDWRLRDLTLPLRGLGVPVAIDPAGVAARDAAAGAEDALLLDALLGTGVSAPPRPADAAVIEAMRGTVVSVDVPSGLDATTGTAHAPTVRAHATCTLGAMKRGLWPAEARACAGRLWVADIGLPRAAWQASGLTPPAALHGGELLPIPTHTPHATRRLG